MFATKPFDIKQIHCLKFFKITILYTTNNLDEYTKFYLAKIAFISNQIFIMYGSFRKAFSGASAIICGDNAHIQLDIRDF